jgi:fructose-1,6-bisphosphatase II
MLGALKELSVRGRVVLALDGSGAAVARGSVVGPRGDVRRDLAVCPLDGAILAGRGLPGAISLLVSVEPGAFPSPPAVSHMDAVVTGPEGQGALDLDDPLEDNLGRIAYGRNVRIPDLAIAVVNHTRNQDLIDRVRGGWRPISPA